MVAACSTHCIVLQHMALSLFTKLHDNLNVILKKIRSVFTLTTFKSFQGKALQSLRMVCRVTAELFRTESGSFRSYSCSVRSFRPGSFRPNFWGESFRPSWGGSFRPYFIGGSFRSDFWGESFRPDLLEKVLRPFPQCSLV